VDEIEAAGRPCDEPGGSTAGCGANQIKGRAARSTAGRFDVVLVVAAVEGDGTLPVGEVAASVVARSPVVLQDTRRNAATTAPLLAPELLR